MNSKEIKNKQQQRKKEKRVLNKIKKKVCKKRAMIYKFHLIIKNH
jgi:hypothetical protein